MESPALISMATLARITVILGAGWLMHFCLAGRNPHWRVLLWRSVTASALIVPVVSMMLPALKVSVPGQLMLLEGIPEVTIAEATTGGGPGLNWLLLIWSSVALALAARKAIAMMELGIKAAKSPLAGKEAEKVLNSVTGQLRYGGHITLRISPLVRSPLVFGLTRPTILLPEDIPADEETLRAVLAHELAHLRNRDIQWLYLIRLCQTVFWFHPLAWGIAGAHENACERVCDDVAAGCVGDVSKYSSTLARMALNATENRQLAFGGISMVRKPQIIKRLEALKSRISAVRPSRARIAAFTLVAVLSLALVSAVEMISESNSLLAAPEEKSSVKTEQANDEWQSVTAPNPTMPVFKTVPPKPELPADIAEQLAATGTKATVIIEFYVDKKGQVEPKLTNIAKGTGFDDLDGLALEWARKIEFKPALYYGRPIKVKVRMPVVWTAK